MARNTNVPYVWMSPGWLDDDPIMDMDPAEFMRKFRAAMGGDRNEFWPYIRRQKHMPGTFSKTAPPLLKTALTPKRRP